MATRLDAFGNPVASFAIHAAHDALDVVAESRVALAPPEPDGDAARLPWDRSAASRATGRLALELGPYVGPSPLVPRSRRAVHYAGRSFRPGVPFAQALDELAHRIHRDFAFDTAATTVTTPLEEVFAQRRGVCQDFAQLMIACLRGVGVPARYVSGYIVTVPPPGRPRLVGADASHAWVSAWCPGRGWIDVDPTNDRRADQDFVTLGWGRDFSDVTPLRGVILGGGAQQLEARVTVTPLSPARAA
jgi:transglutaminase-like putative cysteine protease